MRERAERRMRRRDFTKQNCNHQVTKHTKTIRLTKIDLADRVAPKICLTYESVFIKKKRGLLMYEKGVNGQMHRFLALIGDGLSFDDAQQKMRVHNLTIGRWLGCAAFLQKFDDATRLAEFR